MQKRTRGLFTSGVAGNPTNFSYFYLFLFIYYFVPAEMQKRTRDLISGVAGKPTTTTASKARQQLY
jgi:hypothetical protein